MPANLSPEYIAAERKLRTAKTPQEKLSILEEMLATIPKHKGTEKMQAMIKTKIAKMRDQLQSRPAVARHGPSYHVEKSGAGQIAVVGPPNSGKSRLIASLTGAEPEVGDYPYTTRAPSPYMMKFENIKIQLVDTPPLAPEEIQTELAELVKTADRVLLVLDLSDQETASILETQLVRFREKRIELIFETGPATEGMPYAKRAFIAANKSDLPQAEENLSFIKEYFGPNLPLLAVSAARGDGLEELRKNLFLLLDVSRVYSKTPGKKADLNDPFSLKKGSTVMDMAKAVHKDFVEKFKYARIWRRDALQGQMINRDFVLEDEDIVELHI
jgi:ribosome-interacting GTPase 1